MMWIEILEIGCSCSHDIVMMAVLCHADDGFEMHLKLLKLFNKQLLHCL
jgi:hypothetical protein